ncbi:MAG: single-stranded DNA-binding protein [Phycisphaeraceae bacterium]|nr:single-stranded DNA-binding protein [Phycisphaeraceae bacterium]
MPNFNKTILVGHLTRDVEVRAVGSGSVTKFGIATNRNYTTASGEKREEVFFGDCEAWGKTGEAIAKFFSKGRPILVEGRLKTESWDDESGKKKSATRIVVDSFAFVDSKPDGDTPRPNMDSGSKRKGGAASFPDDDSIPF